MLIVKKKKRTAAEGGQQQRKETKLFLCASELFYYEFIFNGAKGLDRASTSTSTSTSTATSSSTVRTHRRYVLYILNGWPVVFTN